MVRFCDKDISGISYDGINRQELLSYFIRGHIDDFVCVFDTNNRYVGNITYYSLLYNENLDMAIDKEVLVLNKDIWRCAREAFENHRSYLNKYPLLPVVDEAGQLISFAYEDSDANRELRQLRELMEEPDAVQFGEIYSEYDCVVIYGFNELAFFFAEYLKTQGVSVRVEDAMWEDFLESDETLCMEQRCMKIYAEGTWAKPSNWEENLLRSVSVEFECIDIIYEENIRRGYIKNCVGNSEKLLAKMVNAEAVAVVGRDIAAQDAYDFLMQNGIEAKCFVMTDGMVSGQRLFGKPLYTISDVKKEYGTNIVLIDNHWENSAWGIGSVDYLDYIGYRRNYGLFLLKDYMQIQGNSLKTALKDKKIVMTGDIFLCERLQQYFSEKNITDLSHVAYINLTGEEMPERQVFNVIDREKVTDDTICLVVIPEYQVMGEEGYKSFWERKDKVNSCVREIGISNYTDYFSYIETFIDIEKENADKYPDGKWRVRSIALGSIEGCNGNIFFDGLLDGHPSIMALTYKSPLSVNIFCFCVWLANRNPDEAIRILERMEPSQYTTWGMMDEKVFVEGLRDYLREGKRYTSQELFVIIHAVLSGKSVKDLSDMIIYWEPHGIATSIVEKCVLWLGTDECPCNIINVVRNTYIAKGSNIRETAELFHKIPRYKCYEIATRYIDIFKKEYENSKRIVIRFEDLKCNPVEELHRVCEELNISWSDMLMKTTRYGKPLAYNNGRNEVKDFDLTPVYNLSEEYLSEFDRFRIALICAPRQKKYGYPYVDITLFSKNELQEMFLKAFRFMEKIEFDKESADEKGKRNFFIGRQEDIRQSLQKVRMMWLFGEE